MKSFLKIFKNLNRVRRVKVPLLIIAIMAIIGFSIVGCGFLTDDSGGNGGGGSSGNGSTREKATLVTVGYSSSHTIKSSGTHWFKFVGTGDPVIFETTGNVVDTYIEVYEKDSSWRNYYNDNSGGGSNALVTLTATSGTMYYIKITPTSGTSGSYTFVVTAPTFNIRTNPIIVSMGNSSTHTISSGGTHWFKFVGTGDRVYFETEGNVVTSTIYIYIGDSTSYTYSRNNGVNFITVSGQTYYIRITGNSGTYTFNIRNGTGDGSSRYNAKEVTKGYSSSYSISYNGEHWFIYQGTGASVTFKTTGNVVDTYIEVYKEDSSWRDYYNDDGGGGSNALVTLTATSATLGTTYYIKVTQKSGTIGSYTFVVD